MVKWAVITHWGRVMHTCVSKIIIIGSNNGLSLGRRHAIISTNDGILLTDPLEIYYSEIVMVVNTFSFSKMHFKISSSKLRLFFCRPQCVAWIILKKHNTFQFHRIPPHWDGTGTWNISSRGQRQSVFCIDIKNSCWWPGDKMNIPVSSPDQMG